jgi:carnosine N-methyltransferase
MNFYALPSSHQAILETPLIQYRQMLDQVDDAIDKNADLSHQIFLKGLEAFGLEEEPAKLLPSGELNPMDWRGVASNNDVDKAITTVRQFYRDWSKEGVVERGPCYDPVMSCLNKHFPDVKERAKTKVLIPGAGLGRLVFEVCRAGFVAEGNEFSYQMLLASSLALNYFSGPDQYDLYPFVLNFSNHTKRSDQLRKVTLPDEHPATALQEAFLQQESPIHPFERMSMCAGDFIEIYNREENTAQYDAVATVFFIDTAASIIKYVETVHNCLKTGGLWVNVGPLKWHWDEEGSIELTNEEVLALVAQSGFKVEEHQEPDFEGKEGLDKGVGYIENPRNMLQHKYYSSTWMAWKI